MAITRLGVRNFRCFDKIETDLPPFAVVIGPNGAGKSNLLHSVQIPQCAAQNSLKQVLNDFGGFDASTCWVKCNDEIAFRVAMHIDGVDYVYEFLLEKRGSSFVVAAEQLEREAEDSPSLVLAPVVNEKPINKSCGHLFRCNDLEGELCRDDGTVMKVGNKAGQESRLWKYAANNKEIESVHAVLMGISHWNATEFELSSVRRPQPLQPSVVLSRSGDNLLSVLYELRSNDTDRYEDLLEFLKLAFPELKRIEFPLVGKGFAVLHWYQPGMRKPLEASQLSDGTLRLLWLTTVLVTAREDSVILLDEPEISLHPQWLMLLVSLMRQTSARAQVIVATHSDQLVRWVEPEELIVADMEDGVSQFQRGSDMDLAEWLKDYTLDQLWLMGELGGRR